MEGADHPRGERYTTVAIILHWSIAALIIFNLGLGFVMEDFPPKLKSLIVPMHASSGITILGLTIFRVIWRLTHSPPPHDSLPLWQRNLAHGVHFLLYGMLIVMPLSGWAIISAHPPQGSPGAEAVTAAKRAAADPTAPPPAARAEPRLWWVLPMPSIQPIREIGQTVGGVAPQKILHDKFVQWHAIGGYIMVALLLLHIAGALKHNFIGPNLGTRRMGLGGQGRTQMHVHEIR